MSHAAVAVPLPVRRLFTYAVPAGLGALEVGQRVLVPFRKSTLVGTVVEFPAPAPDPGIETRPIARVLHAAPRPTPAILELTRFVADYYLCSWGEAIDAALPPGRVPAPRRDGVRRLPAAAAARIPRNAPGRRLLLDALPADGTPVAASALPVVARNAIAPLVKLGWVERVAAGAAPAPAPIAAAAPDPHRLTAPQAEALGRMRELLAERRFAAALLFGATGSGKTEVYLQAARAALDAGRSVIYLVPEIGLTPLLMARVSRRFPGEVVVLHSGLPPRERLASWRELERGTRRFVVGTRSAIFAPLDAIGLIVVDEEQDGSYKQAEAPRYNGRDLAVLRGRSAGALVVLGSATPSMESFRHARAGRYELIRLGGRIDGRALPAVRLVDMREEYRRTGLVRPLSRELLAALEECVGRGDQAIVLRNRRGWASALLCPSCGERVQCRRCSISMTWHKSEGRLRCHLCGFELPWPRNCPSCGKPELKMLGEGTERVEDAIRAALPEARVVRLDRDSLRGERAHERVLERFERREIDVLVGTQMVAKGHDFPGVTLVGVVSADQALGLPDFRAGERTFQLLTQVAGRAGRGPKPGRVVAQAFDPAHPLLRQAVSQDFEGFYEREIVYRRALRYPPLAALVQLLVVHPNAARARVWAEQVAEELHRAGGERLIVAGPGPAPIERIKGRSRQQILVRSAGRRRLVEAVGQAVEALSGKIPSGVLHVDVDPVSVL